MNSHLQFYFSFLVIFLFSLGTSAQEEHDLIKEISYLKDANFDIKSIDNQNFNQLKNAKIGFQNGCYWFKVILKDAIDKQTKIVFDFDEPSIQSVSVFNARKHIITKKSSVGNSSIYVQLTPKTHNTYYIKTVFKRQVHFPLKVYYKAPFQKIKNENLFYTGLYYGLVIMVFIINFVFYSSLKDKTFLYYCLFLGSINLAFSGFDGIIYWNFPQFFFDYILIFTHYLIQIFGVIFAAKYLNLPLFQPKAHKIGIFILLINLLFYAIYFISNDFLFCAIGDTIGLLILGYYWSLGLLTLKKSEYALFFVIGYSMVLIAGLLYLIPLNFGISSFGMSLNQVKFGAIFEMFVLTYAIAYRVKKIHEENNLIQNSIKNYINQVYLLENKIQKQHDNTSENPELEQKIKELSNKHSLTDREAEILLKISEGFTNNQIAEKLFISVNTVKYHTRNLYEKLEIKSKNEAISLFI